MPNFYVINKLWSKYELSDSMKKNCHKMGFYFVIVHHLYALPNALKKYDIGLDPKFFGIGFSSKKYSEDELQDKLSKNLSFSHFSLSSIQEELEVLRWLQQNIPIPVPAISNCISSLTSQLPKPPAPKKTTVAKPQEEEETNWEYVESIYQIGTRDMIQEKDEWDPMSWDSFMFEMEAKKQIGIAACYFWNQMSKMLETKLIEFMQLHQQILDSNDSNKNARHEILRLAQRYIDLFQLNYKKYVEKESDKLVIPYDILFSTWSHLRFTREKAYEFATKINILRPDFSWTERKFDGWITSFQEKNKINIRFRDAKDLLSYFGFSYVWKQKPPKELRKPKQPPRPQIIGYAPSAKKPRIVRPPK